MNSIKTKIVSVGNSKGIRIPTLVLEMLGFKLGDTVELRPIEGNLVISKGKKKPKESYKEGKL